ncbi:MAG: CBS domain-containing protein [Planctomycetes bacterium]|nr:CBS domain-containing protein [Planctomycetota bacterium]
MTIGRICNRDVDTAEPQEFVRAAAQRMGSRAVGTLLVLDRERRPVGILTDRDIAVRVVGEGREPNSVRVSDVMSAHPHTVSELAPLEDAIAIMRTHGVRRVPVVSPQGALVGLITLDDVLSLLAEDLWSMRRVLEKSSPRALAQA